MHLLESPPKAKILGFVACSAARPTKLSPKDEDFWHTYEFEFTHTDIQRSGDRSAIHPSTTQQPDYRGLKNTVGVQSARQEFAPFGQEKILRIDQRWIILLILSVAQRAWFQCLLCCRSCRQMKCRSASVDPATGSLPAWHIYPVIWVEFVRLR